MKLLKENIILLAIFVLVLTVAILILHYYNSKPPKEAKEKSAQILINAPSEFNQLNAELSTSKYLKHNIESTKHRYVLNMIA